MQLGGINSFSKIDPEAMAMQRAKQIAQQKKIPIEQALTEAKAELRAQYGDPKKPEETSLFASKKPQDAQPKEDMKANIEAKLRALGIPSATIQQGPQAVGDYAKEHNIQLPPPPQPPVAGSRLNLSA
jgi:hypothetical protein